MVQNRLIPVLLLKREGLYKTIQFKKPRYIGDPRNAVKIFNEKEVDEICILDITASKEKRAPNFQLIEEIVNEAFMPLSYGGGIRSMEDVQRLFSIGIEKVVINSALYDAPELIKECSRIYGDQSIVASLDVKKYRFGGYRLFSQGGGKRHREKMIPFLQKLETLGIGEVMINSIDKDGLMQGMDIDLLRRVSAAVKVPVVGVGGVGNLQHVKDALNETEVSAIGIGSFFVFHGKHKGVLITYPSREELKKNTII